MRVVRLLLVGVAMTAVAVGGCASERRTCADVGFDGPVAASARDALVAFLPTQPTGNLASPDAADWDERSDYRTDDSRTYEVHSDGRSTGHGRKQLLVERVDGGWKVTGSCA